MDMNKVNEAEQIIGRLSPDELVRVIDDIVEDLCCSDQMILFKRIYDIVDGYKDGVVGCPGCEHNVDGDDMENGTKRFKTEVCKACFLALEKTFPNFKPTEG